MGKTALFEAQRSAGGICSGEKINLTSNLQVCYPPVFNFGDAVSEYKAAQGTAALFDVSDRTQIEVTGNDRQKFLHNFCTNDVNRLKPGEGCEAFATNVKGKILGHLFIFAGEESLWIETVPGVEESLCLHLDRYIITEDVELHRRTEEVGELLVSGSQAAEKLQSLSPDVASLPLFGHFRTEFDDIPVIIRRVNLLGSDGIFLSASRNHLADLWQILQQNGFTPAGGDVFHALRIESGFPLFGLDINEDNLAQEATRTSQAISFTKGCYLGQEPIARLDALGHVNRELRGLRFESESFSLPGATIFAGDDEKEIGTITSMAYSPVENRSVALAMVRSQFSKSGTVVRVKSSDSTESATIFWAD